MTIDWTERKGAIEQAARNLMDKHGLTDWQFAWDKAKTRVGCCHFRKRRITLSAVAVPHMTELEVYDTILHEIAHALVGPKHRHDYVWRLTARRIGCTADRCLERKLPIESAYVGTCPECGLTVRRHRMTNRARRVACGRCCARVGRFDERFRFQWERSQ